MTQTQLPLAATAAEGWHTGPMLALDFETNGTDPSKARPVSVACSVVLPDGTVDPLRSYQAVINCGLETMDPGAFAVHGITLERIRYEGDQVEYALNRVLNLVEDAFFDGVPVCIFNAPYDWPLFKAELRRNQMTWAMQAPLFVDPLTIDRHLDKSRAKRNLAACCTKYGVALTAAHDAAADAIAAVAVAREQAARTPELHRTSLDALQGLQARWYADWARGFSRWLVSTGRDPITNGWPE